LPGFYIAWLQEIFMPTPEGNPQRYRESSPINYAEGLKGRLLIVHGTGETNTHIQITER
jgi:dipeptidyl-peptidase-4